MMHRTLLVALVLAVGAPLSAQTVDGRLVDARTNAAIAGASISLIATGGGDTTTAVTDGTGLFHIAATVPGTYVLRIRRIGIKPALTHAFWLGPLTERRPLLRIEAEGVGLDTMVVTTKGLTVTDWTQEFYMRRRTLNGIFLTRADVANRKPQTAADWLLGVRGVTVDRSGGRVRVLGNRSAGGCAMSVYMDELPIQDADMNVLLRAADIVAVEVYQNQVGAPVRYRHGGCGLVLVWTRSDFDPTDDVPESPLSRPRN